MKIKQFFSQRLTSIQAQMRLGLGIIFAALIFVTGLNIYNLLNVQQSVGEFLINATQVQVLSSQMQNDFLQARQNEATILTTWRSVGFVDATAVNLEENARYLSQAQNTLDEMDNLVINNSEFQGVESFTEKTAQIRPLLRDYETTFLDTIETIELRSQAEGLESRLQTEFDTLDDMVRLLEDDADLGSILRLIRSRERTYFITGQQEHVDSIRLLITTFDTIAQETQLPVQAAALSAQVDVYFAVATDLFELDQQIKRSSFVFEEITKEIGVLSNELQASSELIVTTVRSDLRDRVQRTMLVVLVVSALTIFIGSGAALYLFRQITRPLRVLRDAVYQVTHGNLEQTVSIENPAEFSQLADGFNTMATRIRDSVDTLEAQVANRTLAIETSALVGRQLSTILDEAELVKAAVDRVQKAFDYYHVHIYLLDEASNELVMAGGTGEAGQTMLFHGHRIPVGKGLVGLSAKTNTAVLVQDVTQDDNWLPNPLLPDSKSEIAVPIAIGDELLGVMDVQHNIIDGLSPSDVDLLQSLTNQIAIGIRNTQTHVAAQERVRQEVRVNEINQKIDAAQSIEEVMQIAVRELGQAIGAEKTVIRLLENGRSETI